MIHSNPRPFVQYTSIVLLLLFTLFLGLLMVQDYGLSWDEAGIFKYSEHLPSAYKYVLQPKYFEPDNSNWILNFYGPAHFLYAELASRILTPLAPFWADGTAQHFSYFLTFLAGIFFLYLLLKRWVNEWAAIGTILLFITQPLLWGHALMNPKDTPFMTFFIISIYLGFRMVGDTSWKNILAAGIVLGITTSIRSLGPMAGVIVLLYGLWNAPRRIIPAAFGYFLVSAIAAYLTWPYLWKAPIENFRESLLIMSQFPFDAKVLFRGDIYPPDQLPRSYVPILFALQLTEPLLVLSFLGSFALMSSRNKEPLFLVGVWFLAPVFGIILFRIVLYDNARQLYFLLPPVFILVGFALNLILKYARDGIIKSFLLFLMVLPGIIAGIRLHPYEYTYYNSFVGGMSGAYKRFETDYWGISFMEAMDYINENAPLNARILVLSGPDETAAFYARPDLKIITEETDFLPEAGYDYVLILIRKNVNENCCKNSETVYTVGRDGVVFTYVNKLGPERHCK